MADSEYSTPRKMTIGQRVVWVVAFAGALGGAGFLAGFVGPIVFDPASNQGPLLGIFFTGPLGVVLGIVLGIILPLVAAKRNWLVAALVIASVLYGGGLCLYLAVTPDPGHAPATAPLRLYALQDANFNLTSISDTSGTVQERYYYDPYGNRSIMNGSWSSISSSAYAWVIGHQGLMIDVESYMIYNRNRTLHSNLGGFTSRDPYTYFENTNLYQYLHDNPIARFDPFGLFSIPWRSLLKSAGFFALCRAAACIAAIDGFEGACAIYTSQTDWARCVCYELKESTLAKGLCRSAALGINIIGDVQNYIGCSVFKL